MCCESPVAALVRCSRRSPCHPARSRPYRHPGRREGRTSAEAVEHHAIAAVDAGALKIKHLVVHRLVGSSLALDVAGLPQERVVALAAVEEVLASAALDDVVAGAAVDVVGALSAVGMPRSGENDRVVASGAGV